jgi:hypothetical protein
MKPTQLCRAALCAASFAALASCANNQSNQGQQNRTSIRGNGNVVNQTNNYIAAPTMARVGQRGGVAGSRYGHVQQCTPERPCYPQQRYQPMPQPRSYQQGNCIVTPGYTTRVWNDGRTEIIPDPPMGGGYGPPPQYPPRRYY